MRTLENNVTVIGGGVAGLMTTERLSRLGYKVTLVERNKTLAYGPSTRNHGWLHSGAYHAAVIRNEDDALAVARNCADGSRQILQYAPEAVSELQPRTFAVTGDPSLADMAVERWNEAEIPFKSVELAEFARLEPSVNTTAIARAFKTKDVPINTRLLYQRLLADCQRYGANVFTNTTYLHEGEGRATLQTEDQEPVNLRTDMVIVTAGYGVKALYEQMTGQPLNIRVWKSHLMIFPRLIQSGLFFLEHGGVNLTQQDRATIVGVNARASLVDTPDYSVDQSEADLIAQTHRDVIPAATQNRGMAFACIKPDIAQQLDANLQLGMSIIAPQRDYIFALPGKMTEAPVLANMLTRMVFATMGGTHITTRPVDHFFET